MKKENLLIWILVVQLILLWINSPAYFEAMSDIWRGDSFTRNTYLQNIIIRYFFSLIGAVGLFRYSRDRNVFNPFLKAYFIYYLYSFLLGIPQLFYLILSDEFPFGWWFYLLRALSLFQVILIVMIYSKEQVRVQEFAIQKKSPRLIHFVVDYLFILLLSISFWSAGLMLSILSVGVFMSIVVILGLLLIPISYFWISETIFQQTLGKVITKSYVKKNDTYRAGTGTIFLRSLIRFIPLQALSYLGKGKGWHDTLSKTDVFHKTDELEDGILEHLVMD